MVVKFERREELAPAVWQYFFTPERTLDYIPGQYIDLHVLRAVDDERGPTRTFTLTSLPNEKEISFTAAFPEPGSVYKRALRRLQPWEELRTGDAMGDVVLPKDPSVPLIFVAGGLGIASFVSILRSLEASQEKRQIDLFYGRRTEADNPYDSLLERFPFTSKQCTVSPTRLNAKDIAHQSSPQSLVYISGSQKFVETMRTELIEHGVGREHIIFDFFDGYTDL